MDEIDQLITGELPRLSGVLQSPAAEEVEQFLGHLRAALSACRQLTWQRIHEAVSGEQARRIAVQAHHSLHHLRDLTRLCRRDSDPRDQLVQALLLQTEAGLSATLSYLKRHFGYWLQLPAPAAGLSIRTNLAEAQLLALIKGLIDQGVIVNYSLRQFVKLAAPHLATRYKKGLSPASFYKSSQHLSADLKKQLKDLLLEISRRIGE